MEITAEKVCRVCDTRIASPAYASGESGFCCETCYLKNRELGIGPDAVERVIRELAEALVAALEVREHETGLRSKRVACHTLVLARRFTGDPRRLKQIYWGALLHDIGKVGIPDAILLKKESLTDAEWAVMRTHPEKGHAIFTNVPFMIEATEIVLAHEERYDGSGYPRGLVRDEIPWGARLFARSTR